MQSSLLSLLLITSKVPTIITVARDTGSVYVNFVAMPRHNQWVDGHLLGLAVKEWGKLCPEDLPKHAASDVDGPDHLRPITMVDYFLKMASIEYLNGCLDLQPYLDDCETALSMYRLDMLPVLQELLKMYGRGE